MGIRWLEFTRRGFALLNINKGNVIYGDGVPAKVKPLMFETELWCSSREAFRNARDFKHATLGIMITLLNKFILKGCVNTMLLLFTFASVRLYKSLNFKTSREVLKNEDNNNDKLIIDTHFRYAEQEEKNQLSCPVF